MRLEAASEGTSGRFEVFGFCLAVREPDCPRTEIHLRREGETAF
jgi:hypothetical protein